MVVIHRSPLPHISAHYLALVVFCSDEDFSTPIYLYVNEKKELLRFIGKLFDFNVNKIFILFFCFHSIFQPYIP